MLRQVRPGRLSYMSGDGGEPLLVLLGGPDAAAGCEDVAEIFGEAFVDPEEVADHGLLVVAGGEAGGAAVFAVPAMGELVGEEQAGEGELLIVNEGECGDAVVAGLMVLEAEVSYFVAEGDEEVICAVVTALIEGAGFAD